MKNHKTSDAKAFSKIGLLGAVITAFVLSACWDGGRTDGSAAGNATASRCNLTAEHAWCDTSLSAQERAERLVSAMTLAQKFEYLAGDDPQRAADCQPYCGIVNGIPELDIPPLRMSDGPLGIRGGQGTAFPAPIALAASFTPELAYSVGEVLADEVRKKGNDMTHSPVSDLIRNPLAGRTFETFGEDPLLSTRMTVRWVQGLQDNGVMSNIKHYLMNTQEGIGGVPPLISAVGGRNLVDVVIDERTLREIYLPPYEAAVKQADVATLMCAYNYLNGEPACASPFLLDQVLKQDWGFDGFLITDYFFAQKDTADTVNVAPVIEMPMTLFFQPALLNVAIATGQISEEKIDENMIAIMRTLFRFGFFDRPAYEYAPDTIDQIAHAKLAEQVLTQGAVLLRNQGMLPISEQVRSIAVIGVSAEERPTGGGSSFVEPFNFISPLQGLEQRAELAGIAVSYEDGRDIQAAADLAASSDLAIVFANALASEGVDKFCLSLDCTLADVADPLVLSQLPAGSEQLDVIVDPLLSQSPFVEILEQAFAPILLGGQPLPVSHRNQDVLIESVAAANPDTAVVLQTGGAVLTPWREQVNAILEVWYPGQQAGPGIASLLFGDLDPAGRLPASFPKTEADHPAAGDLNRYPGIANKAQHSEGIFIGYRWHDQFEVEPAYPFGFGLSYTRFDMTDFQVSASDNNDIDVVLTVSNIGDREGYAVPQLYVGLPAPSADVPQAPRALKGFEKVKLAPGESRIVNISLTARDLSYWDVATQTWAVAPGCYAFMLGSSSRSIQSTQRLGLQGGSCLSR